MNSEGLVRAVLRAHDVPTTGRLYGVYRATVISNEDPRHLGRLKLWIPVIHGDTPPDANDLNFAWPCTPFAGGSEKGVSLVPDPGDSLWVAFEGGEIQCPVWIGGWWGAPQDSPEMPEQAHETGQNAPSHHVLYRYGTMIAHAAKDSSKMRVDLNDETWLEFFADGRVRLQVNDVCAAEFQHTPKKVTIYAEGGVVTIENQKVTVDEAGGAHLELVSGDVMVADAGGDTLTMSGGTVTLQAASLISLLAPAISVVSTGGAGSVQISGQSVGIEAEAATIKTQNTEIDSATTEIKGHVDLGD